MFAQALCVSVSVSKRCHCSFHRCLLPSGRRRHFRVPLDICIAFRDYLIRFVYFCIFLFRLALFAYEYFIYLRSRLHHYIQTTTSSATSTRNGQKANLNLHTYVCIHCAYEIAAYERLAQAHARYTSFMHLQSTKNLVWHTVHALPGRYLYWECVRSGIVEWQSAQAALHNMKIYINNKQ